MRVHVHVHVHVLDPMTERENAKVIPVGQLFYKFIIVCGLDWIEPFILYFMWDRLVLLVLSCN